MVKGRHEGITKVHEGIERTFDASWSVVLDVFGLLRGSGMISAEIGAAGFGQLVLLEGTLSVYDISMLKQMYRPILELMSRSTEASEDAQYKTLSSQIDLQISSATGHQKQEARGLKSKLQDLRKQSKAKREQETDSAQALFDIIALLPHALQATLENQMASVWMTLVPDEMIGGSDDFTLKHVASIPGTWSVIGALDARPVSREPLPAEDLSKLLTPDDSGISDETFSSPDAPDAKTGESAPPSYNIVQGMKQMQDGIRSQFGRPDSSYGITPLVIYRLVEAGSSIAL